MKHSRYGWWAYKTRDFGRWRFAVCLFSKASLKGCRFDSLWIKTWRRNSSLRVPPWTSSGVRNVFFFGRLLLNVGCSGRKINMSHKEVCNITKLMLCCGSSFFFSPRGCFGWSFIHRKLCLLCHHGFQRVNMNFVTQRKSVWFDREIFLCICTVINIIKLKLCLLTTILAKIL